jgi:spore maturation protein CgeB
MEGYQGANYQQDVIEELRKQAEVFFYGPGFPHYDHRDSIFDVLAKAPFEPDAIIVGHSWLSDQAGCTVDPHPSLRLSQTSLMKVAILNKEYVNLQDKLEFIRANRFSLGVSHHHDSAFYKMATQTDFLFWPFAFNHHQFGLPTSPREIDLSFSGILQNQNKNAQQTDVRVKVMKHLFQSFFDMPFQRKRSFEDHHIFWNAIPRNKWARPISAALGKWKYLSSQDYCALVQNTKIYLNTLSPMGLISPRFFECMGSGALVFCEESELYQRVFSSETYVTFKADLSDFDERFIYFLRHSHERNEITKKAYSYAQNHHTWEKRIQDLLKTIDHALTGR